MNRLRLALLLLVVCLAVPSATLAALPAGVTRGASVEGIDEYGLANGLKVLLFRDATKPTITVNITYLVGSRHENYGETGMAHLLEHLVFKGTPKHANIPQELTAHGARPNGSTSYDRTNYFETFAASDENLTWALDLEADRMVNSFIAKKDLDSEMTVVRNEFEMGENSPQGILFERVLSTAYLWHNYGKSTIGARADIEHVPIDRLQGFYRNWYQPDNAVLVVAGNFDADKTLALINDKFGAIPRPARALLPTYTEDPVQDGERAVTLRRVGDTQEVIAAYHVPASTHPDSAALDALAFILGDTPAGRLHKALVETKKATAIFGFDYALREPGMMLFGATVLKENPLDDARNTLLEVIEKATATPITAEEVERAKTSLLKDIDLTLKSSDRVGLELSEWLAVGDWRMFFIHRDRVKALTAADVQRVAGAYLKSSNRTLGQFYPTASPERAEIPAAPDVVALTKDYKGGEAIAAGEAFDPSPANIDKRTERIVPKSGLKLALLPKKTRGEVVQLALSLHFGSEQSLKGKATAGDMCGDMLMRGTAKHTRQQIQDEFDRLKARAMVMGSPTGASVSIEVERKNLGAALRLAAEVLREPSFPASEFETLRQEDIAAIEEQKTEPAAMAATAFSRYIDPRPADDVRYNATPDEAIARYKAATLDEVKAFYRDFYGASAGELAVVGDFDAAEVKQLAQELFGGWNAKTPYERIANPFRDVAPTNIVLEAPDKANANIQIGLRMPMRDDDPDYPAMTLSTFMVGGGFLNSRLAVRIRQKEGLSYGVGAGFSADPEDKSAGFFGRAIFAPENAERIEKAFREELAKVAAEGFTESEVKDAKAGWLQGRQVQRAQDRALAGTLAGYSRIGRTMAFQADLEQKVAALTPAQLQAAFKKFVSVDKLVFVRAGDFAGAKKKAAEKK